MAVIVAVSLANCVMFFLLVQFVRSQVEKIYQYIIKLTHLLAEFEKATNDRFESDETVITAIANWGESHIAVHESEKRVSVAEASLTQAMARAEESHRRCEDNLCTCPNKAERTADGLWVHATTCKYLNIRWTERP